MDEREARAMRRDILADIGALLREELAADAWGRLLVEVGPGPDGTPTVANIDVEEVVGDEARVDAVFGGAGVRAVLPVLAKAVEALCALDGLELQDVRGGTFVRLEEGGFAWLPALVRAPSVSFDRDRDRLLAKLRAKNERLTELHEFPRGGRVTVDLVRERLIFARGGGRTVHAVAHAIGTFAPASRTWGWAGYNPHAPAGVRKASSAIVDAIPDRDMWELSTPAFATDETTAWALAALVCDRAGGDGVYCASEPEGLAFVLLREAREAE
jgi:hypothetical protein